MSRKWRVHPSVDILREKEPNIKPIVLLRSNLEKQNMTMEEILEMVIPTHEDHLYVLTIDNPDEDEDPSYIIYPYYKGRYSRYFSVEVKGDVKRLHSYTSVLKNKDVQNEYEKHVPSSQLDEINKSKKLLEDKRKDRKIERNNIMTQREFEDAIIRAHIPNYTEISHAIKMYSNSAGDTIKGDTIKEYAISYLRRFRCYGSLIVDLRKLQLDCEGDLFNYFMKRDNYYILYNQEDSKKFIKFLIDNEYIEEYEEEESV